MKRVYQIALVLVATLTPAGTALASGATVEDGSTETASEVSWGIYAHINGIENPILRCDNHWELSVNASGVGTLDAEGISEHPSDSGACETAEPCNDHAPWPIHFSETEDPLEINPEEFEGHLEFCLEQTGNPLLESHTFHVEGKLVNSEEHFDKPIAAPGSPFPLEVMGEVTFADPTGLMHD